MTSARMDRRRFLKLAGASAGLAAAHSILPSRAWASGEIPIRVGAMLPTGASYAGLTDSLRAGLQMGFAHAAEGPPPIRTSWSERAVDRGYGGAFGAARELLDEDVDVVVAGVTSPVAHMLTPMFEERGVPLVVAGVGGHLVRPADRSDLVLHNSLLYWRASYAAGSWSASNLGTTAIVAGSFADTGYDTVYAFRQGFASAGGSVLGTWVTHELPGASGLPALYDAISAAQPSVVYGVYSGSAGVEFVRGYAAAGSKRIPLVVGGLAAEDYLLPSVGRSALGMKSVASWSRSRATRRNQEFVDAFAARTGRSADPFAALGYDTALLVAEGARRALASGADIRDLIAALQGVRLTGPRGRLTVDPVTNSVTGPLSIREVRKSPSGPVNVEIGPVQAVRTIPPAMGDLLLEPASGYLNECLCA